jgi:hypothetical protein
MSPGATGPWDLPVEGWEILTVIFAFQIDILAYGGEAGTCTIRLAAAFRLTDPDGHVHELDAEQNAWEDLTPVLTLRRDKLVSLNITEDACLTARFGSGRSLIAEADDRPYEHWQVTVPEITLISLPGKEPDGVATWGGE